MVVPRGNNVHVPYSMKNHIIRTRKALLSFRVLQMITSAGALTTMVIIVAPQSPLVWLLRIAPGIAFLHTLYATYHLSRKASGRTPASSASYMLFGALFDLAILGVFGVCIYTAYGKWDPNCGLWEQRTERECQHTDLEHRGSSWGMPVRMMESGNPYSRKILLFSNFILFSVGALFFLISFGLSVGLFKMFRGIVRLPPDSNPLEDNLTSRPTPTFKDHKRNKSDFSTTTYDDTASARFSTRSTLRPGSKDVYDDLGAPPSIPFMHTRTNSNSSLQSYTSIPTTNSPRDSRLDLPSRSYQIPGFGPSAPNSARNSVADLGLKRTSQPPSPTKRGGNGYSAVGAEEENWFTPPPKNPNRNSATMQNFSQPSSPRTGRHSPTKSRPQSQVGGGYAQLQPAYDFDIHRSSRQSIDLSHPHSNGYEASRSGPNPLGSHPPTISAGVDQRQPKLASPTRVEVPKRESALSAMTVGRMNTVGTVSSSVYSREQDEDKPFEDGSHRDGDLGRVDMVAVGEGRYDGFYERRENPGRELTPSPKKTVGRGKLVEERRKMYGDLGGGSREELGKGLVKEKVVGTRAREVSGNDFGGWGGNGMRGRDVSGKAAEEGRGGGGWGARFRKVSGLGK